MARSKPDLHVVGGRQAEAPEPDPDEALAELVPQLLSAERELTALRFLVSAHRLALAKKRRVAFIRDEAVRREFGK